MSLQETDKAAADVAKSPETRVKLTDIEAAIEQRIEIFGPQVSELTDIEHPSLNVLSICILVMKNGFTVIGKSAPADPQNYNEALGRKFAYEDAVRQLWPLMGYALRDKLAGN